MLIATARLVTIVLVTVALVYLAAGAGYLVALALAGTLS